MMKKTLVIILDACRHDYVTDEYMPLLFKRSKKSYHIKKLQQSLGFCERSEILTGGSGKELGFLTSIGFAQGKSEYYDLRFVSFFSIIEKLLRKVTLKNDIKSIQFLIKLVRSFFFKIINPKFKKMHHYNIPINMISYFGLTEDEHEHTIKNIFSPFKSIFDHMSNAGMNFDIRAFTALGKKDEFTSDYSRRKYIKDNINNDSSLFLLYQSFPDINGHIYGPDSTTFKSLMKTFDKDIDSFLGELRDESSELDFIIIGDHGMSSVKEKINIESHLFNTLTLLGICSNRIIYFVDSTILRIWFKDKNDEKIFKEHIYKDTIFVEKGWFATEELSNQYSFPYEDIRYGQILWIANSGVLLSPDFYHSNCNYKGMHGYRPDDDNSFGFLIYDSDKYHPYVVEKDKLNSAFNIIRKSLDLF